MLSVSLSGGLHLKESKIKEKGGRERRKKEKRKDGREAGREGGRKMELLFLNTCLVFGI